MKHHLGLAARTQISVCKSLFLSAGTAVSLFRAKNGSVETTVAEEGGQNVVVGLWEHRIGGGTDHQKCLPVSPPLTFDASWLFLVFLNVNCHRLVMNM